MGIKRKESSLAWPSPNQLERRVRSLIFAAGEFIPPLEMVSQKSGICLPVINDQEAIRREGLLQGQQIHCHLPFTRQLRAIKMGEIRSYPGHILVAPSFDAVLLNLDKRSVNHPHKPNSPQLDERPDTILWLLPA